MSENPNVTFGPPANEGWTPETRWRRPFHCACGYEGWEYWNDGRASTLVCTKCFNGRHTPHDSAVEP